MGEKPQRPLTLVPKQPDPPPRKVDPAWQREMDEAAKHGVTYDPDTNMPRIRFDLAAIERRYAAEVAVKLAAAEKREARRGLELVPAWKRPKKSR